MDKDTELILDAIKNTSITPRKRKIMLEFDDLGVREAEMVEADALSGLSKKMKRRESRKTKYKRLPLDEWSKLDFLTYTQDLLSPYHIYLENNGSKGADTVARMYDKLAVTFGYDMNNCVLKEYLEWWVLAFASGIRTPSIYIQRMWDEKYVEMFARRYNKIHQIISETVPIQNENIHVIFQTGGLPMLLMKTGIVISHSFLQEKKDTTLFTKLSKALRTFSSNVLKSTMDLTIRGAPYPMSKKVDFLSIARPALELRGLTSYLSLDYKYFFKE